MVGYDEYSGTKGVSSGVIWQDSAVSAARLVEKYMSQEEQQIQLSDLHSGNQSEYDMNGVVSQLQVHESFVSFPFDERSSLSGFLTGTSYMWRSVEGKLAIWDSLDRMNERSHEFVASRFPIMCVGLVEGRKRGVFFLVVATTWDVSLFYFDPEGVLAPVLSGFVTPTAGVGVCCISGDRGRIYLGGADGSVFEMIYDSKRSSWLTDRCCWLSVIYRPLFSGWWFTSDCRIVSLAVCKGLVFALSQSDLRVFGDGSFHLSEYTITEAVRRVGAVSSLVEVVPAEGDIVCVIITRNGTRVFVKKDGQIFTVKIPPRHPAMLVERALSPDSGRTIAFITASGAGIVWPDVQAGVGGALREKFEFYSCLVTIAGIWRVGESVVAVGEGMDLLLPITVEPLGLGLSDWELLVRSSPSEQISISLPSTRDSVCDLLRQGLNSVRELSLSWQPEQLAAQFFGMLLTSRKHEFAERLLFSNESAIALGLVDHSIGMPGSQHVLGSAQTSADTLVSGRTRGIALLLSRLLRPMWFQKAFCVNRQGGEKVSICPVLSVTSRNYFSTQILAPVAALLGTYKYQLTSDKIGEARMIEGFSVLVNSLVETMELFRLFETGQLCVGEGPTIENNLAGIELLLVRDIVMSAGLGDPVLKDLLARDGIDSALVRKRCPLIVPNTLH